VPRRASGRLVDSVKRVEQAVAVGRVERFGADPADNVHGDAQLFKVIHAAATVQQMVVDAGPRPRVQRSVEVRGGEFDQFVAAHRVAIHECVPRYLTRCDVRRVAPSAVEYSRPDWCLCCPATCMCGAFIVSGSNGADRYTLRPIDVPA